VHITYDPEADVLAITWRDTKPGGGKEVAPDLFVECDAAGQAVGLELLRASKHLDGEPLSVSLEMLAREVASGLGAG